MQDKICPLLLISKKQEDTKEHALCRKDYCAWWYIKASTATGPEISGKCCMVQIAEALR